MYIRLTSLNDALCSLVIDAILIVASHRIILLVVILFPFWRLICGVIHQGVPQIISFKYKAGLAVGL